MTNTTKAHDTAMVTQADALLAEKFWRVHPSEIMATGMTREEWYAHHIARHRTASQAELLEALRMLLPFADDMTQSGCDAIAAAEALIAKIEGEQS